MLERREEPQSPWGTSDAAVTASRLADAPATDPRVEDYLDHLCIPLIGRVPYAARATLRSALRAHLEALIDACEELGWERDEAVWHAVAQFGDPHALGREWLRAWRRDAMPDRVPSARPAMLVALRCFGAATGVAITVSVMATGQPISPLLGLLCGLMLTLVIPLLAGLVAGWLAPARQALGSFYALSLVIAPTTLGSAFLCRGTLYEEMPVIGILQVIFWLPIGCAAAAFGGWLRSRREQAPKRWVLPG